jgi:hypothetical protein
MNVLTRHASQEISRWSFTQSKRHDLAPDQHLEHAAGCGAGQEIRIAVYANGFVAACCLRLRVRRIGQLVRNNFIHPCPGRRRSAGLRRVLPGDSVTIPPHQASRVPLRDRLLPTLALPLLRGSPRPSTVSQFGNLGSRWVARGNSWCDSLHPKVIKRYGYRLICLMSMRFPLEGD